MSDDYTINTPSHQVFLPLPLVLGVVGYVLRIGTTYHGDEPELEMQFWAMDKDPGRDFVPTTPPDAIRIVVSPADLGAISHSLDIAVHGMQAVMQEVAKEFLVAYNRQYRVEVTDRDGHMRVVYRHAQTPVRAGLAALESLPCGRRVAKVTSVRVFEPIFDAKGRQQDNGKLVAASRDFAIYNVQLVRPPDAYLERFYDRIIGAPHGAMDAASYYAQRVGAAPIYNNGALELAVWADGDEHDDDRFIMSEFFDDAELELAEAVASPRRTVAAISTSEPRTSRWVDWRPHMPAFLRRINRSSHEGVLHG